MKKLLLLLLIVHTFGDAGGVNTFSRLPFKLPIADLSTKLVKITYKDLIYYPKYRNVSLLLAKAQYEKKITSVQMLQYRRLFMNAKAGDYKLLNFLKNDNLTMENAKRIANSTWPKNFHTIRGTILFKNPHVKGRLGDHLTAKRLTAMGYKKLNSKYNSLHGIDGIYIKQNSQGKIIEIKIVENKVDSSTLQPGPPRQMSSPWIENNLKKMMDSSDGLTKANAALTLHFLKHKPSIVSTELWHHDLGKGITVVRKVDKRGFTSPPIERYRDRMIFNTLENQCQKGKLICMPYGFQ